MIAFGLGTLGGMALLADAIDGFGRFGAPLVVLCVGATMVGVGLGLGDVDGPAAGENSESTAQTSKWRAVLAVFGLVMVIGGGIAMIVPDAPDAQPKPAAWAPELGHDPYPVPTWKQVKVPDPLKLSVVGPGGARWTRSGGRLKSPDGRVSIELPEATEEVVPCEGNWLVTDRRGGGTVFSATDGEVLGRQLVSKTNVLGKADCRWGSAFIAVQEGDGLQSYVYRGRARDLESQARIDVGGRLSALIDGPRSLLVADDRRGSVSQVDVDSNEVMARKLGFRYPTQFMRTPNGYLVIEKNCLRQLTIGDMLSSGRSVRMAGGVVDVARMENTLLVLAAAGTVVQRIGARSLRPLGPPVRLPKGVEGRRVAVGRSGWHVTDSEQQRWTLGTHEWPVLERLADQGDAMSRESCG